MLTLSQPSASLPKLTVAQIAVLRDGEWEARERSYHEAAVEELNSLVRRYNGLAPYAVRRAYYMRTAELEKAYQDGAEDILQGIADRINNPSARLNGGVRSFDDENGKSRGGNSDVGVFGGMRFRDMLKEWFSVFTKRGR